MSDRIRQIWGMRTPHAAGDEWPVRVDQFLADGVDEAVVTRLQSACVLCSNGCGRTSPPTTAASAAFAVAPRTPTAQEAEIAWVILAQVAQVARDQELLVVVSECHEEAEARGKWLRTRITESSPQVLATA